MFGNISVSTLPVSQPCKFPQDVKGKPPELTRQGLKDSAWQKISPTDPTSVLSAISERFASPTGDGAASSSANFDKMHSVNLVHSVQCLDSKLCERGCPEKYVSWICLEGLLVVGPRNGWQTTEQCSKPLLVDDHGGLYYPIILWLLRIQEGNPYRPTRTME